MAFWTFTPPNTTSLSTVEYGANPLANRLAGHFRAGKSINNVFIWSDGTVSESQPEYWENPNGTNPVGTRTVARVFYGAHTYTDVTDAEKALLQGAGYTVT